jgi:hypothetical protein
MEARRAHRGEPPFFTTNLGARSVFVQQQPPHAWVTLMKVAVSVFPDEYEAEKVDTGDGANCVGESDRLLVDEQFLECEAYLADRNPRK